MTNKDWTGPVYALIPEKVNSSRVIHKYKADICGKPNLLWTVEAALACDVITDVWVIPNDPAIPKLLSEKLPQEQYDSIKFVPMDKDPLDLKIVAALQKGQADASGVGVLLQATSPLRTARHIAGAIRLWRSQRIGTGVMAGFKNPYFRWFQSRGGDFYTKDYDLRKRPNSQQRAHIWQENGAIYVNSIAGWYADRCRVPQSVTFYEMSREASVELDSPDDLHRIRLYADALYGQEKDGEADR